MYGMFTYISLMFIVNVSKYTSPMDATPHINHQPPTIGTFWSPSIWIQKSCIFTWKRQTQPTITITGWLIGILIIL